MTPAVKKMISDNFYNIRDTHKEHFYTVLASVKTEDELIANISPEEVEDYLANDIDDYAMQEINDMVYIS